MTNKWQYGAAILVMTGLVVIGCGRAKPPDIDDDDGDPGTQDNDPGTGGQEVDGYRPDANDPNNPDPGSPWNEDDEYPPGWGHEDTDGWGFPDSDVDVDVDTGRPGHGGGGDWEPDTDPDRCLPDDSISLGLEDSHDYSVNFSSEAPSMKVSCSSPVFGGSADRVLAVTLTNRGDLSIRKSGESMGVAFALFSTPASGECPTLEDEIGCQMTFGDFGPEGPFGEGGNGNVVFKDLARGEYILVISDSWGETWNTNFSIGLYREDCVNGIDDNFDGATDCAEAACVGIPDCIGGTCDYDEALGLLAPLTPKEIRFDIMSASNDLRLSCGWEKWGPDHVVEFSVDVTSDIFVQFDATGWGEYALGLLFEAGPGEDCTDFEHSCTFAWVEETGTYALNTEPLPKGTYYFVTDAQHIEEGGDIRATLTAVPSCPNYQVWDKGAKACKPWDCNVINLGTFTGTAIVEDGNTCTGTDFFGSKDMNCTDDWAAGHELIYQLQIPAGETIDLMLVSTNSGDSEPALYILLDCNDFSRKSCLAGENDWGNIGLLDYTNTTGSSQTVFIVADAFSYEEMEPMLESQSRCGEITLVID